MKNCYLQGVRTPWLVRWPGQVKPASVDQDRFISGIDLMPTILDIARAPLPKHMKGRSIVPMLKGEKREGWDRVYSVYDRAHGNVFETRAIHTARYGYIYNHWADGKMQFRGDNNASILEPGAQRDPELAKRLQFYTYRSREEFYDYTSDPHSLNNLVSDPAYAKALNQMRRDMQAWLIESGDPNASGYQNYVRIGKEQG